jgi:signal transduction histidine kinase
VLALDTTGQKQLQASLFQSASLTAIGQLATSIAHEVNNPLTIALTNTQLIMMNLKPGDPSYEMIEDIHYACNRIGNIVANLVDFSNQAVYEFSPVNLIETIEDTLIFIAHPLREAGIEIERAYNETPTITASRNHLKTIWINLLRNACEAIKVGRKPGKISIDIHLEKPDWVIVEISDTGIGIARKHTKSIFTPFFSTKPASHSVGLGLFTTRTIVDKHQGRISFTSKPGHTIFTVALPERGPGDLYSANFVPSLHK